MDNEENKQSILSESEGVHTNLLDVRNKNSRFDALDDRMIWGYGVGHFINDLVAACWFNYLFFYLKKVVKTPAASSAMLAGQIADGIATPIVGFLSDKYKTKYGQRTPWYIGGLILVVICYIPIYQCYQSPNKTHEYAYYTIFPALFNCGWAALQISHMSLVPALTCSRKRRDKLNNLRNSFTFISNFLVLGMGLIIFKFMSDPPLEYRIISYIVVTLGISASLFFLFTVREVPLSKACHEKAEKLKKQLEEEKKFIIQEGTSSVQFSEDDDNFDSVRLSKRLQKSESIKDWFKMPKFYLFGICYMGVRLCANMFGTLLPFYLTGVLKLGLKDETDTSVPFTVALVPLIVYTFSVISSFLLNWFYTKFGRKLALAIGTIVTCISLGSLLLLTVKTAWVVYIIAVFIGLSQTMVLATGINFISDVVGTKAKTGAFVFGIYSLLDKFSAGAVIFLFGNTQPYTKDVHLLDKSDQTFIKLTMVLIPALSAVLATLIVIFYPIQEYSKKQKKGAIDILKRKSSIEEELVT